jgi:hypothetical protein
VEQFKKERNKVTNNMGVFEIIVAVAVQSAFRVEMHKNKVFLFLKNYF